MTGPYRPGRVCACGVRLSATNKSGRCRRCYLAVPARDRTGTFGAFQLHPSHLLTGPEARARARAERQAALTVCEHARDLADARDLLTVVGLIGGDATA